MTYYQEPLKPPKPSGIPETSSNLRDPAEPSEPFGIPRNSPGNTGILRNVMREKVSREQYIYI